MQLFVIRQVSFVICSKALYFFILSIVHCLQIWAEQESVTNIYLSKEQPHAPHHPTSAPSYEFVSPPEACIWWLSDASWYHRREAQNQIPVGGVIFLTLSESDNIQERAQFTQLALKQQANNQRMLKFFVSWKNMFVKLRSKDTEWGFGGESRLLWTSVGQMRMWEVRSDLNNASQWGHTDNQCSCVL